MEERLSGNELGVPPSKRNSPVSRRLCMILFSLLLILIAGLASEAKQARSQTPEPDPSPPANAKYIPPSELWPAVDYTESGWPKGGGILPGEVTVVIDNQPKVSTVEEWAESCHQFELTVSGEQAFGCVQYGAPMLGTPEDVMRVHVWLDRGETILIVGGAFKVSEAADENKETLLELARSIQLL